MNELELLGTLKREYGSEWDRFPRKKADAGGRYSLDDADFGPVDAEILYAAVRHTKPKTVLLIGSVAGARIIRQALDRNASDDAAGRLATVGYGVLTQSIATHDLVVADTSHMFVPGHEVDQILAAMAIMTPGKHVYFHDIFLPEGYPRAWADRRYDEQVHLQAFLDEHFDWKVLLAANRLHKEDPSVLSATFATYDRQRAIGPGSFWLTKEKISQQGDIEDARSTMGYEPVDWDGVPRRDVDPGEPHPFYANRNAKQCLVCRKGPRNAAHQRP